MEVEPDLTIEVLKQKIQEQHEYPAESQQLVAYGKVLSDHAKTLTEYSIKDGDFIVVMIKKAKPAPKAQTAPKAEAPKAEEPKPV